MSTLSASAARSIRVDAEHMLAILGVKGWQVVDEPDRAEAIVVNTCAFIDESKEESVDAILEMAEYKDHGRCRALVVSGCLAQRYADQLAEEMPEVDYFLGTAEYAKISEVLERAGDMPRRIVSDPDFVATSAVPRQLDAAAHGVPQDRRGLLEQMCVLHHPNASQGAK